MSKRETTPFRRNRYPGFCRYCRARVPAQAGSLVDRDERGWIVAHNKCVPDELWSAAAESRQASIDHPMD